MEYRYRAEGAGMTRRRSITLIVTLAALPLVAFALAGCGGGASAKPSPPRVTGRPAVGSAAKASLISTTTRSDGKPQVTYNGHPLYTFSGDEEAGDTNGEGVNAFGGIWYVVSPSGNQIATSTSTGY